MENLTLTKKQLEIYRWLSNQGLNTDSATLIYWSKKYPEKRLKDVVEYALKRQKLEAIRNIGGWIQNMLKKDFIVVNKESVSNENFAKAFAEANSWKGLKIYEKYVKDEVTQDDLPLTMSSESFQRSLEGLYQKSQLYS